ncbi:MAG: hypothetical protein F8N37_11390 [Telmatospirillum sp.]|nr:hypothetical protein [Telmatospirillum sp.]
MSVEGRAEMRRVVERLLTAFLREVETKARSAPLDIRLLNSSRQSFLSSPELNGLLTEAHRFLLDAAEKELIRQKRRDPFNRLLTHPLSDLFSEGRLSRDILASYFSFLHLVLGDTRDVLASRCAHILDDLRAPDPLVFSWDSFYADPRARQVLWTVLIRIAESFRRFEIRRDWFIGLMQNRPQAVSLGSHSFMPRPSGAPPDEILPFGREEFLLMFNALFADMRDPSAGEARAFERDFGVAPARAFGALFAALDEDAALDR